MRTNLHLLSSIVVICILACGSVVNVTPKTVDSVSIKDTTTVAGYVFDDSAINTFIAEQCDRKIVTTRAFFQNMSDTSHFIFVGSAYRIVPNEIETESPGQLIITPCDPQSEDTPKYLISLSLPIAGFKQKQIQDTIYYAGNTIFLSNGNAILNERDQPLFPFSGQAFQGSIFNNLSIAEKLSHHTMYSSPCKEVFHLFKYTPEFTPIIKGAYYITTILVSPKLGMFFFEIKTHNNRYYYVLKENRKP